MTRSRISLTIVSALLVFVFVFSSAGAGSIPNVSADAPIDVDGGPTVPWPVNVTYDKFPDYTFYPVVLAEKYRVKVYNTRTAELLYTLRGGPRICTNGVCTLSAPDIALKFVDLTDRKGSYYWTLEALVLGAWTAPESHTFQVYAWDYSTKFLTLKKWQPTYGVWRAVSPGYAKVKPAPGQYASLTYKNKVTTGYVFEARMKRAALELTASNFIIVKGQPDLDPSEDGWGKGIMFSYDNSGNYRVDRWVSNSLVSVVGETYDGVIRTNDWNTLTAFVYNGFVHFYINGVEIYESPIKDSDDYGWVGVGAYEDDAEKNALLVDSAKVQYTTVEPYTIP